MTLSYDDYKGKAFMHSHTYAGNPIGRSLSLLAVLNIMKEENILENAKSKAKHFNAALNEALLITKHW